MGRTHTRYILNVQISNWDHKQSRMSGSGHQQRGVICSKDCRTRCEFKCHLRFIFHALSDFPHQSVLICSVWVSSLPWRLLGRWIGGCMQSVSTVPGMSLMCGTMSSWHSPAPPELRSHQNLLRQVLLLLFLGFALCCQAGLDSCWAWGHQSHCESFLFPPASPSCWRNPCPLSVKPVCFGVMLQALQCLGRFVFPQTSQQQPFHSLLCFGFHLFILLVASGGWAASSWSTSGYLHFVAPSVWVGSSFT